MYSVEIGLRARFVCDIVATKVVYQIPQKAFCLYLRGIRLTNKKRRLEVIRLVGCHFILDFCKVCLPNHHTILSGAIFLECATHPSMNKPN